MRNLPVRSHNQEPVLLIDLGANVDCSARHLCEFAEMGQCIQNALGGEPASASSTSAEQVKGNEF